MPVTVKVNGTANSLVHKGSNHVSIATIPDVCKTPSPGGPIPIPYPNISQSVTLAKGTTSVKADGMMAAIKGSEFSLSNGDNAGVAGGVKSSTFMKESTWILYSFDVKMDGQGACRLSDKKFQNHENTVDLMGALGAPVVVIPGRDQELDCGEYGTYGDQKKRTGKGKYDRDHIPSKAALKERARQLNDGKDLSPARAAAIDNAASSVAIPKAAHSGVSPTYGGRNSATRVSSDAGDLQGAAKRDTGAMKKELDKHADSDCVEAYKAAAEDIDEKTNEDYDAFLNNILNTVK